jgi:hypothetical protein
MNLLKETEKVTITRELGIISFIDKKGKSKSVLKITKSHMINNKEFEEIMKSIEIRFKKL